MRIKREILEGELPPEIAHLNKRAQEFAKACDKVRMVGMAMALDMETSKFVFAIRGDDDEVQMLLRAVQLALDSGAFRILGEDGA